MGVIRLEVHQDALLARNRFLRGSVDERRDHATVVWRIPPLAATLPLDEIGHAVSRLATSDERRRALHPQLELIDHESADSLAGFEIDLYRLRLSPLSWIDIWTSGELPEHALLRQVILNVVGALTPDAAELVGGIPGMPLHVQLHSPRYGKVDLLRLSPDEPPTLSRKRGFAIRVPFPHILLRARGR